MLGAHSGTGLYAKRFEVRFLGLGCAQWVDYSPGIREAWISPQYHITGRGGPLLSPSTQEVEVGVQGHRWPNP